MTAVNRRKKVIGLSLLAAAVVMAALMWLRSRKYETVATPPVADPASHPIYSAYEGLIENDGSYVLIDPNESFRAQTIQAGHI